MKVPEHYYTELFDFAGQWDVPSRCGLKILDYGIRKVVVVTELYQDNPGTSVTYNGASLAHQICESKHLDPKSIIYIECDPDTHSKLSFYDEEFFEVHFDIVDGVFTNPQYKQLLQEEIMRYGL